MERKNNSLAHRCRLPLHLVEHLISHATGLAVQRLSSGRIVPGHLGLASRPSSAYYRLPFHNSHRFARACTRPPVSAPLMTPVESVLTDPQTDSQNTSMIWLCLIYLKCATRVGDTATGHDCVTCADGFSRQGMFRCTTCAGISEYRISVASSVRRWRPRFYVGSSISCLQQEHDLESIKEVILNYLQVITQFQAFSALATNSAEFV